MKDSEDFWCEVMKPNSCENSFFCGSKSKSVEVLVLLADWFDLSHLKVWIREFRQLVWMSFSLVCVGF